MKLELKHIAPYLPHVLEAQTFDLDREKKMTDVIQEVDFINDIVLFFNDENRQLEYIKPILRPISDIDKVAKDGKSYANLIFEKSELLIDCDFEFENFFQDSSFVDLTLFLIAIEMLYEFQFDVKGLIKKGLAIDINTFK